MEGIDRRALGERIAVARKELGLHQSDLAERLNVSLRSVQLYESGDSSGVFRHLGTLEKILGKTSAWMMYGERDRSPAELTEAFDQFRDDVTVRLDDLGHALREVQRLLSEQNAVTTLLERVARLEAKMDGPL